jgi:pimeloyl-ACP methyl ester carboxylesterase
MHPDNARFFKSEHAYQQAMALYKTILAEITVPYESTAVETRYGMTQVLSAGPLTAQPVVLWHSGGTFGPEWYRQINALAQQYRVFAPDVIGSMGKSAPTRLNRNGPAYGEWMADVLDQLQVERGHMIGISNGAWLVLKLATVAPERIASALLMGAAGFVPLRLGAMARILPVILNPFQTPETKTIRLLRVTSPPDYQPDPQQVQLITLLINYFRAESVPKPLTDSELVALTAPTALLMGEYDRIFNGDLVIERARKVLPNLVQVERVPGVGHRMISEGPDALNKLILAFLVGQQA